MNAPTFFLPSSLLLFSTSLLFLLFLISLPNVFSFFFSSFSFFLSLVPLNISEHSPMRAGRRRSHEPTPGGGSGAGGGIRMELGGDRHDNYYSTVTTSNSTPYERHMYTHSQGQGPGSGSGQGGSGSQTHSPINPNSKHGLSGMSRSPGLTNSISYEQSVRDNQIREHRDQPVPGIFGLVIPGRKGEGPVQRKALTPRPHHNQSNGNLYMEPPFRERTLSSSTSDSKYITLFNLHVFYDYNSV
jgi:hypothetical protein